jgi:hypothetical protein
MSEPATQSRGPGRTAVEVAKGFFAGLVGALMALFSALTVLFGILLSVLPLLLVIAAIAGGVYLIVH